MANAMAAIRLFAKTLENNVVKLRCDNSAAVSVLSTGRGIGPVLLACARVVWKCSAEHNFTLQVSHIEGKQNILADKLSRAHMSKEATIQMLAQAKQCNANMLSIKDDLYVYDDRVMP